MNEYVIAAAERPTVTVAGSTRRFPVHRIYCVGRNYAEHAREMGYDPTREPPFFFCKPADAIVEDTTPVPYPPRTANFHHEIELVVAIGKGGSHISAELALGHVYGYGVGIDWTRRDLQAEARNQGRPWDTAKGVDHGASLSALVPASEIGHPGQGRIWLAVDGHLRQDSDIRELIWSVPEVIAELSTLFELLPGDLIYTGTPSGVGPVQRGQRVEGGIDGIASITTSII
jgi:fumarylpyruvate hydrolase